MNKYTSVAVFGGSGYLGKSLIREFIDSNEHYKIYVFSRSLAKLHNVRDELRLSEDKVSFHLYEDFMTHTYDVILNCMGITDMAFLQNNKEEAFSITEKIDTLALKYLTLKPNTCYVALSSGAVYKDTNLHAMTKNSDPALIYAKIKQDMEVRHRAMTKCHIIDIRIFSFFSQYVDLDSHFFMSSVVKALIEKKIFQTDNNNLIRDYLCPSDLFSLINCCIKGPIINDFIDAYSCKPASKLEILSFLEKHYGLRYDLTKTSIRGFSNDIYYAHNTKASQIGYTPQETSLTGIDKELRKFLKETF